MYQNRKMEYSIIFWVNYTKWSLIAELVSFRKISSMIINRTSTIILISRAFYPISYNRFWLWNLKMWLNTLLNSLHRTIWIRRTVLFFVFLMKKFLYQNRIYPWNRSQTRLLAPFLLIRLDTKENRDTSKIDNIQKTSQQEKKSFCKHRRIHLPFHRLTNRLIIIWNSCVSSIPQC